MDKGNWVPLDKRLTSALPKDRPYTILEATFSLQVDIDCNNLGSINGYASLWQWSNRKVKKFIDTLVDNKEEYPIQMGKGYKNDKVKAQQKHNKSTTKAQQQFRIINKIKHEKHNKSTIKAQQKHSTNNPNPNPNPKEKDIVGFEDDKPTKRFDFDLVWKQYPNKDGKKAAERHFKATVKTEKDWEDIQTALKNYKADVEARRKNGFPNLQWKSGSTWFNNWSDWVEITSHESPEEERSRKNWEEFDKLTGG